MIFFFLTILVFFLDQVSKYIAFKSGIFIDYNSGISFGLFSGNIFAQIISIIVSYFLIYLLIKYYFVSRVQKDLLTLLSFSFILGGSLGNTFDRISRGYVPDFINLNGIIPFWSYDWYSNFADVFIVAGLLILTAEFLFAKKIG